MSESKLVEAVRAFLGHWDGFKPRTRDITAAIVDLQSALAAHDSAQAGGERVRIAVAADGDKWCAYGWNGADDKDMMDNAEEFLGTESAEPLCFIEAVLPERAPVPTVQGEVVQ